MKRLSGFTFVEIMLAVTIFAIVAVVLYSVFNTGISVWRKSRKAQDIYLDVRLTLDTIARELEMAVLYSQDEGFSNFVGKPQEISFYSPVQTFAVNAQWELKRITYCLEESKNSLQRQEEAFAQSEQEISKKEKQNLIAGVNSLNFFYYDEDETGQAPYQWKENWGHPEYIPQAIRIELATGEKGQLFFEKYIFIPSSEREEQEE